MVVGDRLCTDVLMAGMMGSYGVWIRDGTPARPAAGTLVSFCFLVGDMGRRADIVATAV